jgi:hypothetical protein
MNEKEAQELHIPYEQWYNSPHSKCSACGHGPLWHKKEGIGCTRMIDGWCICPRVWTSTSGYTPTLIN